MIMDVNGVRKPTDRTGGLHFVQIIEPPGGHTQTSLASINKILTPKIVINEKVTSLKLPESLQKVVPSSSTNWIYLYQSTINPSSLGFKSISTIPPSELVDFPINLFH